MMPDSEDRVLEMRVYRLLPGSRERFDEIFRGGALPMLRRYGINVVGFGPSLIDENGYYLLRSYPSVEIRRQVLDSFYGSDEWLAEYDEEVMSLIDTYNTAVVEASPGLIRQLSASTP